MSSSTSIVEPISNFVPSEPAKPWIEPNDLDLIFLGLDRERYGDEMSIAFQILDDIIGIRIENLNKLPETPELKALRGNYDALHKLPMLEVQNPMRIFLKGAVLMGMIWDYYHESTKKVPKVTISSGDVEGLAELPAPEGVTQLRAMVILRALKARPKLALHTEDCRKLLEGAEGRPLDYKVVRRAMKVLVDLYPAKIAGELFDGSYRVRIVS